ncbi:hypothetical protein [Sphingobacterium multivorum]|uniref:hypothetical protein n=1 Tax=Sphingobacterium multivorum TaxID=28454 RepID=UPI003DA417A5
MEIGEGGILRIRNAARRIDLNIHLIGSRAKGTARANSDYDYAIPGINSKKWCKIKNSLPGSKSIADNLSNRIDLFKYLDESLPFITITP